jgi:glycosyltransferase involved in cell wall biosynthesis
MMPLDRTEDKKFRALTEMAEVFVLGLSQDSRPRRFRQHAEFFLLPTLPVHVLRLVQLLCISPVVLLWMTVRHRIDVITAQSPYEGFIAAVVKTALSWIGRKVAVVVEDHGNFEEILFLVHKIYFPRAYRFVMERAAGFGLRRCDVIRTVSGYRSRHVTRLAPDRPIMEFPAWTDVDVFLDAGARRQDEGTEPRILYAGVLTPLKGIHHLVRALARVRTGSPMATLVIAGAEENKAYVRSLRVEVANLALEDRVQFRGEISQTELADEMRRSRVLVLPSYTEGLPRVIVEALVVGTPVIASAVGGIPEIVEDGVVGFLVQPGDEDALTDRLERMLGDEGMAKAMGRSAKKVGERIFSTRGYVLAYERLFAEALQRAGIVRS